MALLPKSHAEFQTAEFWDTAYSKLKGSFEWYAEFTEIAHLLTQFVKVTNKVLEIGCGNSTLAPDMMRAGWKNLSCIDISPNIIKKLKKKHPSIKYSVMDATALTYEDDEFDVVLDKGTLDAIFTDESEETIDMVSRVFKEVIRVLKFGGRYLCVSLAQRHIVRHVTAIFSSLGAALRVIQLEQRVDQTFALPVFVFVVTKLKPMPQPMIILEYQFESQKPSRFKELVELENAVVAAQQLAVRLNSSGKELDTAGCYEFCEPGDTSGETKYLIYVVRSSGEVCRIPTAVFVAAPGFEDYFEAATHEGRMRLRAQCGVEYLLLVIISPLFPHVTIEAARAELTEAALAPLLPPRSRTAGKLPLLSFIDTFPPRSLEDKIDYQMHGGKKITIAVVEMFDNSEHPDVPNRYLYEVAPDHVATMSDFLFPNVEEQSDPYERTRQANLRRIMTDEKTSILHIGLHRTSDAYRSYETFISPRFSDFDWRNKLTCGQTDDSHPIITEMPQLSKYNMVFLQCYCIMEEELLAVRDQLSATAVDSAPFPSLFTFTISKNCLVSLQPLVSEITELLKGRGLLVMKDLLSPASSSSLYSLTHVVEPLFLASLRL